MIVTAGLSVIKSDACAQSQSGLKVSFHKYYNLIAVLHAVRILYDNKHVQLWIPQMLYLMRLLFALYDYRVIHSIRMPPSKLCTSIICSHSQYGYEI